MDYNKNFNLQLFGKVSNPYEFNIDGNYIVNADITSNLVDLTNYAAKHIPNFDSITEIPEEHLEYLQSNIYASSLFGIFADCYSLESIPNLNINTSNVEDMTGMFHNCNSLTNIEWINYLDTSNVTTMYMVFEFCRSIETLNLSNFDTSNVTKMDYMFNYCSSLINLNISNWDTSNVKIMTRMISNCTSLTTITGVIDMKSCTEYSGMFADCPKLTGVKIKNPPEGFDGAGLNSDQYTIVS